MQGKHLEQQGAQRPVQRHQILKRKGGRIPEKPMKQRAPGGGSQGTEQRRVIQKGAQGGEQVAQAPHGSPKKGRKGTGLLIQRLERQNARNLPGVKPGGGTGCSRPDLPKHAGGGPVQKEIALLSGFHGSGKPQQPAGIGAGGFPTVGGPNQPSLHQGRQDIPRRGDSLLRRETRGANLPDDPKEGSLPQTGTEKAEQPGRKACGKALRKVAE